MRRCDTRVRNLYDCCAVQAVGNRCSQWNAERNQWNHGFIDTHWHRHLGQRQWARNPTDPQPGATPNQRSPPGEEVRGEG
jgi:hypothetical protein